MTRLIRHVSRLFASIFAILAIFVMLGAWHLSSVTLSSKNWTPYIETVFEQIVPDSRAVISKTSLNWDHQNYTLALLCEDIKLRDRRQQTVISFPKASLKISLWSLLSGHFLAAEFFADEAKFWLMRHKTGEMTLGTALPQKEEEQSVATSKEDLVYAISFLQNIADELAADNLSHKIKIKSLAVKLFDEKTKQTWQLKVPELNLVHEGKRATGTARVILNDGSQETSALQLTYDYDNEKRNHKVGISFQDIRLSSLALFAPDVAYMQKIDLPVSGAFSVEVERNLSVAKAHVTLAANKGIITVDELWENPRPIKTASFAAQYNKAKGKIEVTEAKVDFDGPTLEATFEANVTTNFQRFWFQRRKDNNRYSLALRMFDLPMDVFGDVWPKVALPNPRLWIMAHMKGGIFKEGNVTIHGHVNFDDLENLTIETGGGKVTATGGTLTYMDGMPPVNDVNAKAVFDLDKMDVTIEQGHTGNVVVKPFTLRLYAFQQSTQLIKIPAELKGPVPDVLKLIDSPRLGYATAMGLDPNDSKGMVDGVLNLSMPLLGDLLMEDVDVTASAKITSFGSAKLVPRIALSKGNLTLDLKKHGLDLGGDISLNGVPATLVWNTLFNETKAIKEGKPFNTGTIKAYPEDKQFDAFYGIGKYLRVEGAVPVLATYKNFNKGHSTVSVEAVLDGAAVHVDQLAWHKKSKIKAVASFSVEVKEGEPYRFNDIKLTGQKINVLGSATLDEETGSLTTVHLNPFIVARHNAKVVYKTPVDRTQPVIIDLSGVSFDTSGLKDDPVPKQEKATVRVNGALQPKKMSIKLKKIYTSPDGFIDEIRLTADRSALGWESFIFLGKPQGGSPVEARLTAQYDGSKNLNITSNDFGQLMKGAGFGDSVEDGKLSIKASSTSQEPHDLTGKIKVSSFTVTDWPLLARLFNALSPFGYVDLITGNASFNYLRGEFVWNSHAIELLDLNAAGSVVGLNIKGSIDTDTNQAAISGTAVPFSFVNSIIGSIPLIGDVITGGKGGGVIAAAFKVTGALSDLDISVNPISLLTPGFLRNIFFPSDTSPTAPLAEDAYPKNVTE